MAFNSSHSFTRTRDGRARGEAPPPHSLSCFRLRPGSLLVSVQRLPDFLHFIPDFLVNLALTPTPSDRQFTMVKIMKPNKVVIVLAGKYAGRKAIILKNHDESTSDRNYGHAVVAGIERYPRPITKKMNRTKKARRNRIKPFVKAYNYNHLMPTRYNVDIALDKIIRGKDTVKDPNKKRKARFEIKKLFEERYKTGKNRWFFTKLRF